MKPSIRKMRALVASATVVVAAAGVFSTEASASIITGGDDVILQTVGFDYGGSGFANGNPTAPAAYAWSQGSAGPTGYTTGYLHFDGVANNCSRIRLISYDSAGVEFGSRSFSPDECVHVDGHVDRYVAPVYGELGAASVEVALQSRLDVAGSTWSTIRRQTFNLPTAIDTDTFRIIGNELDFGTGPFNASNTASDLATVTWQMLSGSTTDIQVVLDGTLYMNQADDLCGRIKVDYISQLGPTTTRYTSGNNCVHNDQLHTFPIHLDGYHAPDVYEVVYTLQKSPEGANNWTDVGTSTPMIL